MSYIWSCVQLVKLHYQMGSITKYEYIAVLDRLFEEAHGREAGYEL